MEDFNVFTEAFNRIEKELNNMDKANILSWENRCRKKYIN